ncbi:uncharacterized protein LOC133202725 [Saccostrea echinata]|uniref:uncharacterized protein LOC133202725 n=1 Tax=Saccostrea echinata TaxID=191078 RepID=UPI002A83582F|nr:uncharacterized protein LOC133202725 [Saccostrea echinata]
MHFFTVFLLTCALFVDVSCIGWLMKGNDRGCPRRAGAHPFYFGTTHLGCIMRHGKKGRKRSAPWRGPWDLWHRFIQYRGYFYDLKTNSMVSIARSRLNGHVCPGARETYPAGYSELSPECIEGCAKNYKCRYGRYDFLFNNCHNFANRLSEVLCRRGTTCPGWCTGSCNDVEHNYH